LAVALPVANKVLPSSNLADVIRIIISNGIILFALSKTKGGGSGE
jgi:simple sugar transport system permease protein